MSQQAQLTSKVWTSAHLPCEVRPQDFRCIQNQRDVPRRVHGRVPISEPRSPSSHRGGAVSELSKRLSQLRQLLDDVDEADKLVETIGDLLAQRNALRAELCVLDGEIVTKRQEIKQEVAALDADLASRQRAFADEIARMEEETATAKAEHARTEYELRDIRMRLDHTRVAYDELRKKFA